MRTLSAILFLAPLLALSTAACRAADIDRYKVVDGVAIHVGVFPAQGIVGRPGAGAEKTMHGGVPRSANRQHVVVALFDAASGRRITAAKVVATVAELGLGGVRKRLEPMQVDGFESYGNYFAIGGHGIYRIRLEIAAPGVGPNLETEIEYRVE